MTIHDYLASNREPCPEWLINSNPGEGLDKRALHSSRFIYYPGAGGDFHAVEVFGLSGAAHLFIMVDQFYTKNSCLGMLQNPSTGCYNAGFLNEYYVFSYQGLSLQRIGYRIPQRYDRSIYGENEDGCVSFAILERKEPNDIDHMPRRLAILFLRADGHTCYEALFSRRMLKRTPYAVLLQDHGFGGNYSPFGHGGILEELAQSSLCLPRYIFSGEDTQPWVGYTPCPEVDMSPGGLHAIPRRLLKRSAASASDRNYLFDNGSAQVDDGSSGRG